MGEMAVGRTPWAVLAAVLGVIAGALLVINEFRDTEHRITAMETQGTIIGNDIKQMKEVVISLPGVMRAGADRLEERFERRMKDGQDLDKTEREKATKFHVDQRGRMWDRIMGIESQIEGTRK